MDGMRMGAPPVGHDKDFAMDRGTWALGLGP